jgi:hypothetical protein
MVSLISFGAIGFGLGIAYLGSVGVRMILQFALTFDYLALYKTRILLKFLATSTAVSFEVVFVLVDVTLSCLISLFGTVVAVLLAKVTLPRDPIWAPPSFDLMQLKAAINFSVLSAEYVVGFPTYRVFDVSSASGLPIAGLPMISTLLTSVWTILILISTTILKLLAPVHRFTAWSSTLRSIPYKLLGSSPAH